MKKSIHEPLPCPKKSSSKLSKKAAFSTLAVEEFSGQKNNGEVPLCSDEAVEQGRNWVNYHKL